MGRDQGSLGTRNPLGRESLRDNGTGGCGWTGQVAPVGRADPAQMGIHISCQASLTLGVVEGSRLELLPCSRSQPFLSNTECSVINI